MDERNSIINSIQGTLSSISSNEEIIEFSDTTFEFDEDKHVKLENNELADILNYSLSKIPDIVVATSNIANAEQVNRVVSDGVFKVVFKNGVTDQSISNLCKNSEDFLITTYRDNNGLFNQAGLSSVEQEISGKMNAVKAANVVNGVMSVASMVVGCYYMHNIDSKLAEMNQKLDKLIDFSDDEKIAQIKSTYKLLVEAINKFNAGFLSDVQINNYYINILKSRQELQVIIEFYETQINKSINELKKHNKSSAEKTFKKILNDISKYMNIYQYAVNVYNFAVAAETIISSNTNVKFINSQLEDVQTYSAECTEKWYDWNWELYRIIHNTKAFNPKLWQRIVSYLPYGYVVPLNVPSVVISTVLANKAHDSMDDMFNKNSIDRRNKAFKQLAESCKDVFKDSSKMLEDYADRIYMLQNSEMGLFYHNGDIYIDKEYLQEINDDIGETRFVML